MTYRVKKIQKNSIAGVTYLVYIKYFLIWFVLRNQLSHRPVFFSNAEDAHKEAIHRFNLEYSRRARKAEVKKFNKDNSKIVLGTEDYAKHCLTER